MLLHEMLGLLAEQGHPLGLWCNVSCVADGAGNAVLPMRRPPAGLRHGLKEASSGQELQALVSEASDQLVKEGLAPRSPRNRGAQVVGSGCVPED